MNPTAKEEEVKSRAFLYFVLMGWGNRFFRTTRVYTVGWARTT
jgi:hypothetical protein